MKAQHTLLRHARFPVILALAMAPCAGAAQTVTVDVQGVALRQVVEQLRADTHADIRTDGLPEDVLQSRVTYKAADVPVKRALREIGQQVGVRLYAHGELGTGRRWFRLMALPPGAVEPPMVQAGPYVVRLMRITVADRRTLYFDRAEPLSVRRHMALDFQAESDTDEDAAALLAIHPGVSVTDDTGQTLEPPAEPGESQLPTLWLVWRETMSGSVSLPGPAKDATSLDTLAGNLVVAAKPALVQFEFGAGELGVAKEQDGYTLRLDSRRERPIEGGVDLQFTLTTPGQPGQPNGAAVALPPAFAGCVLRLNVKQDDGAEIEIEETTVTTAGAPATVEPDGTTRRQLTCRAYGIPEGATLRKVICSLFHRGHETKLIPFSFQNVPLPTPDE